MPFFFPPLRGFIEGEDFEGDFKEVVEVKDAVDGARESAAEVDDAEVEKDDMAEAEEREPPEAKPLEMLDNAVEGGK